MALIMTKRMSVLTALILVPVAFALIAGFRANLGPMMLDGVKALAPTAVMLLFAILFFSVMIDVGLFEPVVQRVVRLVQGDPLKIVVGTSILTLLVSLDGDGSTTYLIVTAALLPLYRRLGLSRLVLASVIMQAGGVMNILPWGGPTARAASALRVDASEIFLPLIPAMIGGALRLLLRGHVLRRTGGLRLGQPYARRFRAEDLRDAKVRDLHHARFVDEQVLRLDVAMHDAVVVGALQRLANRRHDGQRLLWREAARLHRLP
jgi:CitMHS family citrate-Mg2+:H+ or citrate-Ca2+:H+ symporter